jgi:hypothetical protein
MILLSYIGICRGPSFVTACRSDGIPLRHDRTDVSSLIGRDILEIKNHSEFQNKINHSEYNQEKAIKNLMLITLHPVQGY